MSVPFPYTINGTGAGIGTIKSSSSPIPGVNYVVIPSTGSMVRDMQQPQTSWCIDDRVMENSNTVLTMISSLNSWTSEPQIYLTLYVTDTATRTTSVGPPDFKIHGASCGIAALLAVMGITTNVAVTGYVQSFGQSNSPALPLLPVDCVVQKVKWAVRNGVMIIIPYSDVLRDPVLRQWYESANVTTYANMMHSNGFDVFSVGVADSLADLGMVLCAMDESVDIRLFMPAHKRAPPGLDRLVGL